MVMDNNTNWTTPIEPEIEIKESEQSFEFVKIEDITEDGKFFVESDEENAFQPVQEYESVLVHKICEVCGNPFQAFEIDTEEKKRPLLTTCEMCSYYIPPHRMDLENKTEFFNSYKCDKCLKSFARKDGLKRHRLTHLDSRLFKCKMCQKCFKRNDKLTEHIQLVHSQIRVIMKTPVKMCTVCGVQEGAITAFVDNKVLQFCEVCNLSRMGKINNTSSESRLFQCDLCSSNFSRKDHAVRHRLSHFDDKPFECYICQKSFNRNDRLLRHLKTHPNAKPFFCKVCFQVFTDRTGLKNHQLTNECSKDNLYKCSVCQKEFRDKKRLHKHLSVHEEFKPYTCKLCDKSFKLQETLLSHQQVHCNGKPFTCTFCGLAFKMEETLKHHLLGNVHEEFKPYTCEDCGESFILHETLLLHKQVHCNGKSFKCTFCELTFESENTLKHHLLVHSNVSSNSCLICSKTFKSRDKLKTHYVVHQDIRPFVCSLCKGAFKRKDKYVRHCREVHGIRVETEAKVTIVCDICGKTFNCEDDLTEHKMAHYR